MPTITDTELANGTRVSLGDLRGTVIGTHRSKYGLGKNLKDFFGYRVQWDNAGIGICEIKDLKVLS